MAVETKEAVYVGNTAFVEVCSGAGWSISPVGGDIIIVIGSVPTDNSKGVTLYDGDSLINNNGGTVYAKSLTANFTERTRIEVITW